MADGIGTGLSRDCESVSDSAMAVIWGSIRGEQCFRMDSLGDAIESTYIRTRRVANFALPGNRFDESVLNSDFADNLGRVHGRHLQCGVSDGESQNDSTC